MKVKKPWHRPTKGLKAQAIALVKGYLKTGSSLANAASATSKTVGFTPVSVTAWYKDAVRLKATNKSIATKGFIASINVTTTNGAIVKLSTADINNIAKLATHI
jgi:hypothetical protein